MAKLFSPPKPKLPPVQSPAQLAEIIRVDDVRQTAIARDLIPIGMVNRLGVQNPGLAIDERRNESWNQ